MIKIINYTENPLTTIGKIADITINYKSKKYFYGAEFKMTDNYSECPIKIIGKHIKLNNYYYVQFMDKFGAIKKSHSNHIKNGEIKNPYRKSVYEVGYLGDYYVINPTINGKDSICYTKWHDMLKRCYKTKTGAIVTPAWLCYSEFSIWFNDNYVENMELDKDLKSVNKKIYSPETCSFLTRSKNVNLNRKDLSYFECHSSSVGDFKNACRIRGLNINKFDKIYSSTIIHPCGQKIKKYTYKLKEEV